MNLNDLQRFIYIVLGIMGIIAGFALGIFVYFMFFAITKNIYIAAFVFILWYLLTILAAIQFYEEMRE